MPLSFLALGPFDQADATLAEVARNLGGELRFARTMAELALPQLPARPDVVILRLEGPDTDGFVDALQSHPKLEGAPLLCVLPRLTQNTAIRASALGADDFLAVDDIQKLLPPKLAAATLKPREQTPPSQCKVLLADASPLHERVLRRLLQQAGFAVVAASSQKDILAALAVPAGFGLIILDLGLPGCDPAALLKTAAATLGAAMPPAIAMTHAGVPADRAVAATASGFRHVHDKRRSPDDLVFLAHEASVQDHAKLRTSPRLLCAVLVGFRREGGRWEYGLTHNISLSGLYVRTIDPPEPGSMLELEFMPPGSGAPVTARARVAWRKDFSQRASRSSPTGMGLQIVEPSEVVQRAMALAVRQLASRPGR
jgi:DNA-binding response OmpR family regulator